MSSLARAFSHFDAKLRNTKTSLSARNEQSKTVVVALWRDYFDYSKKPAVSYRMYRNGADTPAWIDTSGNRDRLADLQWAQANCDGRFRVVIVQAVDPMIDPREVGDATAQQMMVMRLTELDEQTGEFASITDRIELTPRTPSIGIGSVKVPSRNKKKR